MSSKLIRGTFILTLGTILSKVLGLIYVIPFYAIIGGKEQAALYQFGYVPYSIFISIATAGVPLAVSKYIAKYNALEEYAVGRKLLQIRCLFNAGDRYPCLFSDVYACAVAWGVLSDWCG